MRSTASWARLLSYARRQRSPLWHLTFARRAGSTSVSRVGSSLLKRDERRPHGGSAPFDRTAFDQLLRRRVFYTPSFEVYQKIQGIESRGLYDYGPPGCALQANIIDLWRRHFVLEEDMLEIDCTSLTPHEVLKTSGHADKFSDYMCKDSKTGEIFRADHIIKDVLQSRLVAVDNAHSDGKKSITGQNGSIAIELGDAAMKEYMAILAKLDDFDGEALGQLIQKHNIKNPNTGNDLNQPVAFNLMFETQIGPSSGSKGYLRPETAQGQFLNFQKLFEFNQHGMPFAAASIGKCFRNEISPRSGLLRVREFLLAEIEHFVDPGGGKRHERFEEIKHVELMLLNRNTQEAGKADVERMSILQAVQEGIIDNETLGYFLARVQLFLSKLGVDQHRLRFRQHMSNEMAHYASDCWDAELLTSYGWIECVGCADRSAYDLSMHSRRTGQALVVREALPDPITVEKWHVQVNHKIFGPHFKQKGKTIEDALASMSQSELASFANELDKEGTIQLNIPSLSDTITLDISMLTISVHTHTENIREYTPNVIEPSFGIGRILYCLLEHSFWMRSEDSERGVLSLAPPIAPTKVLLTPLSSQADLVPLVKRLSAQLRRLGISAKTDTSGASIGKRYARSDELGTPLAVTVDFQSVRDGTVTLRERDTTRQVRAGEDTICEAIRMIIEGEETWDDVSARLPTFEG